MEVKLHAHVGTIMKDKGKKQKFALEQSIKAQRGTRNIALFFL